MSGVKSSMVMSGDQSMDGSSQVQNPPQTLEAQMFPKPLSAEEELALQGKFAVVGEDSRELALQYLDMQLGEDFPETRLVYCDGCKVANGNAWDAIIYRFGRRNKPQLAAASAWECENHP